MASQPAERASGDVYSWEYAGSEEHAAGMQRAVRDDIIYDKHTGLANFISIFGESPRQMHTWLCRRARKDVRLGNVRGARFYWPYDYQLASKQRSAAI